MNTSCQDCVFAEWELNELPKPTQIDCCLDKLNKYADNKVNIVPVTDGKNYFYVLENKLCRFKRTKEWLFADQPDKMEEQVYEEVKFAYQVFLYVESDDLAELEGSLESVKQQEIQPKKITIIKKLSCTLSLNILAKLLNRHFREIKWRIETVKDAELPDMLFTDILIHNEKFPFYLAFYAPNKLPNFTTQINKLINYNMLDFGIVNDPSFMLVSTAVHVYYGGNSSNKPLETKLHELGFSEKVLEWKNLQ